MANVLTAVIRHLGEVEAVILGERTLDTGWAQLAGRVAGALNWPQVLRTCQASIEGGQFYGTRLLDGEYERVMCELPVVIATLDGAWRLRYPNGTRLINTYRSDDAIEEWSIRELLSEDKLVPILHDKGLDFAPERERGVRLEGSSIAVASAMAEHLRSRSKRQGGA